LDLIGLIPSFGNLAFTIVAFVVALLVIVTVHEYGHYIVGRWTGIHADVFSLGFGPVIWKRFDRRGTRWQIAALPLGGYVKFKGDADAASGKDGAAMSRLSPEERRRTMHGAPLWARAATVAAGPVFNFIFSIAVFAGYFLINGVSGDTPVVGSLKATPYATESLLPGDRITAVNGIDTPDMDQFVGIARALPPAPAVAYTVDRAGQLVTFSGPYPFPPIVDTVVMDSAARDVGITAGDVVQSIDGQAVASFEELRTIVGASNGKPLLLKVWRAGDVVDIALVPRKKDQTLPEGGFETRWQIGMSGGLVFDPELRTPGVFEAVSLAGTETWRTIKTSMSGLWHMATGKISPCNLQGAIGIAETSGEAASQGVQSFILFIAFLSTGVGLLNLFPIPVLDGGHLVFYAYEAVVGRPPTDRVLRVLMMIGITLVLGLMIYALSNDVFCA
jgi:regulator of sigma E protease